MSKTESINIGDYVTVQDTGDGLSGIYYVEGISPKGNNLFLSRVKGQRWSACISVNRCTIVYLVRNIDKWNV